MPLRDLIVTGTMIGLLPLCLVTPWIGILVWSWIGLMNPHRLTWGFAYTMPFAMLVAVATLAGAFLTADKERRSIPAVRETWLLLWLWAVYTATTLVALYPDEAYPHWVRVSKILLFTFLTVVFFQQRERFRWLLLVVALSLGFYGLKGAAWVLRTGGSNQVMGPPDSFIEGNTEIGLALNMTLPLLLFLARGEQRPWLRKLMLTMFGASIVAIVFTYSRGAFLGLAVVLMMLFLRARRRLVGILAVALLALFVMMFVPERWFLRMDTIQAYEQDASSRGRLVAWGVAWGVALDRPLTGGGFWVLPREEIFERYAPGYPKVHSAHSIYFAVLGDHGFLGLALFIGLIVSCLVSLVRLRRSVGHRPEAGWLVSYCEMTEASLVAYAVSGAFLTMAYFDLFYYLVSFVIILKGIAAREGLLVESARSAAIPVGVPAGLRAR